MRLLKKIMTEDKNQNKDYYSLGAWQLEPKLEQRFSLKKKSKTQSPDPDQVYDGFRCAENCGIQNFFSVQADGSCYCGDSSLNELAQKGTFIGKQCILGDQTNCYLIYKRKLVNPQDWKCIPSKQGSTYVRLRSRYHECVSNDGKNCIFSQDQNNCQGIIDPALPQNQNNFKTLSCNELQKNMKQQDKNSVSVYQTDNHWCKNSRDNLKKSSVNVKYEESLTNNQQKKNEVKAKDPSSQNTPSSPSTPITKSFTKSRKMEKKKSHKKQLNLKN